MCCTNSVSSPGNPRLGRRQHRLEARILAQRIEIGIDLGMVQEAAGELREHGFQHVECGVRLLQVHTERTREVVPHVQIVGVDQQGARNSSGA